MSRLAEVLQTGDFTFVVAAQRFVGAMEASVDYLNSVSRYGRYFLVEVIRLEGGRDVVAHMAQVVAAPSRAVNSGRNQPGQMNANTLLERLPDSEFRDTVQSVFATAESLGLRFSWGSKGVSIRLVTPDRAEPLSIAWVFPDGEGWFVAKHLTLGVDKSSLAYTPSVRPAVEGYLTRVASIPGAQSLPTLPGSLFIPSVAPSVKDELIGALTKLVEDVRTTDPSTLEVDADG